MLAYCVRITFQAPHTVDATSSPYILLFFSRAEGAEVVAAMSEIELGRARVAAILVPHYFSRLPSQASHTVLGRPSVLPALGPVGTRTKKEKKKEDLAHSGEDFVFSHGHRAAPAL